MLVGVIQSIFFSFTQISWSFSRYSIRTSQHVEQYLKKGMRIKKERDKREKTELRGLSVNTAAVQNLFLISPFIRVAKRGKQ